MRGNTERAVLQIIPAEPGWCVAGHEPGWDPIPHSPVIGWALVRDPADGKDVGDPLESVVPVYLGDEMPDILMPSRAAMQDCEARTHRVDECLKVDYELEPLVGEWKRRLDARRQEIQKMLAERNAD